MQILLNLDVDFPLSKIVLFEWCALVLYSVSHSAFSLTKHINGGPHMCLCPSLSEMCVMCVLCVRSNETVMSNMNQERQPCIYYGIKI